MTLDQLFQTVESLSRAGREAIQNGTMDVDLLPALRAADDAAREELASAIEAASQKVGSTASFAPVTRAFQLDD